MLQQMTDRYDHPIYDPKRLHLDTMAIKKLREEIHRWLWNSSTGGLVTGTSRAGKTHAVHSLRSSIYTRSKKQVPVYYASMPLRDQHTIASVFRQLCLSHKLRVTTHDRADHLSDRFIHFIADKSVESNCSYAVLIIDEIQRLHPEQLNAFAEIYDKLLMLDISLMVIFVGNDSESEQLIEHIETPRFSHIYGRFFTQRTSYLGLTSEKQLKYCLTQYDQLRYPVGGPTYVAYFLPKAAKQGWKLASVSNDIWRIFREYQKTYKISSWGMQYFTASINTLLMDFLSHYGVESFNDDMMCECINISGLISSNIKQ